MKESDIRPADLFSEYLRLSRQDAERLMARQPVMRRRSCPGCGADDPVDSFFKHGFTLGTCGACATLYAVTCLSDADLASFYQDSPSATYWAQVFFPAVSEVRRERIFAPRVAAIADLLAELGVMPHVVMDVGAGSGLLLEELRARLPATRLRAVEPSALMAEQCRQRDFDVFEGFSDDAALSGGWAASADLVTCFEVIEHVPDPQAFVTGLAALVRPGGLLLMTGLCGTGFDVVTLKARSNSVAPPHHLNFLSRRGLGRLLERVGLEEVRFLTPGRLDVDIVRNALTEDDEAVGDPFLRHLLLQAPDSVRAAFQEFLAANTLSSHMWSLSRRPA